MERWKKSFITIWTGQAISILTSSVLQMAIVWYVTKKTESAALLTLSTLIGFLPQALLGIFIGVYIDRYSRKSVMIWADLMIAFGGMILVIAGIFGDIPLWLIYLVLCIRSIGNAFHQPALQAAIPAIVPRDKLTQYAGYAHSFKSFSMLISPALAAVLFSVMPLNWIIFLDVIGALLAIALLLPLEIQYEKDRNEQKGKHFIREAQEGFAALRRQPGLPQLLLVSSLYAFIYFPIGSLFPLITMTWFRGGVPESGLVEVIFSVGMLVGSFTLGLLGHRIRHLSSILGSIGVYGCCILAAGLLPPGGLAVFVFIAFIIGIINPFYHSVLLSLYQLRVEEAYLGRVLSLTNSLSLFAMPLGLILAGNLADVFGVNRWFVFSGIMTLLLCGWALYFVPRAFRRKID